MSGKIISYVFILIVVFAVLAIVFPDSTKGFFAKTNVQIEKIEKNNTVENSIEILKSRIEDMENEYYSKLEKVAEIKSRKINIEKEIKNLEKQIIDSEENIKKLAEIYNTAKSQGKEEVEIGNKKYTLNDLIEMAKALKNEIKNNLKTQIEQKNQVYEEILMALNKANDSLEEYRTKIEEEKARLARVTAKKMSLEIKKELKGFEDEFMTGKYTKTGEDIEKALDEELMKYEAREEVMNSNELKDINEISKELDKISTNEEIDEEIKELFNIE
ncbi:coiled-coil domain-containing protein [Marinitoga litoralis]|uniref:coiled-coil domain-containing protein n=1 Tax=Marinitoga litoralis TaxID=570855 RepID=UPI0019620342|nr:hypothetical protein [Marinitoga litoralis]MBM7560020.1 phage shock protein A [Marinitoga litoralis]